MFQTLRGLHALPRWRGTQLGTQVALQCAALMQGNPEDEIDALATVIRYHELTKHRMDRYAPGPETLDWDAAPASFRTFSSTMRLTLPLLEELPDDDPVRIALGLAYREGAVGPAVPWSRATLGVLLQCSLGVTAWKRYGPDRWAVRANPSSGNLHPVEGYVLSAGLNDLPDGLYHYDAQAHALELRAQSADDQTSCAPVPTLAIGLTSVMWREAWKYGERAFRYCQLDTGHAMAAIRVAAAALGASLSPCSALHAGAVSALLGLDRIQDFPAAREQYTELEEPELVLQLHGQALSNRPVSGLLQGRRWGYFGTASAVDPHPMYRWRAFAEVALATRARRSDATAVYHSVPLGPAQDNFTSSRSVASVVLGRRSAQRFDIHHQLDAHEFFSMLRAVMPVAAAPWDVLPTPPAIDLVLFVHRVLGLPAGLYLLERCGARSQALRARLGANYAPEPVVVEQAPRGLFKLTEAEPKQLMRVARALHCHQDIAAASCYSLGMLAELPQEPGGGAHAYRTLLREAGVIGQQLYLAAEARQLRGTGIGCYFDDAVGELLGLRDGRFQSLYHFTVGRALDDPRIETGPAYPHRHG